MLLMMTGGCPRGSRSARRHSERGWTRLLRARGCSMRRGRVVLSAGLRGGGCGRGCRAVGGCVSRRGGWVVRGRLCYRRGGCRCGGIWLGCGVRFVPGFVSGCFLGGWLGREGHILRLLLRWCQLVSSKAFEHNIRKICLIFAVPSARIPTVSREFAYATTPHRDIKP